MSPVWITIFLAMATIAQGAKILIVFNAVSRSHFIMGESLGIGLAEKGHEVTMISAFSSDNKLANYKEIVLDGMIEEAKQTQFGNIDFELRNMPTMQLMQRIVYGGRHMANATLYHPKVVKLLESNAKFDVFITQIFLNECLLGMARHFDAIPVILSTIGSSGWTDRMVGNPNNPGYIAHPILSFDSPMSYTERIISTLFTIFDYSYGLIHTKMQHDLYADYFKKYHKGPEEDFPHLENLLTNVSLILINSNYIVNSPRALVPNIVEICGLHINRKPLPENLKKFLDSAKEGVIYFSMGSNLKSAQLPKEKREAILNTFRKMKQKIIWKWEDVELPNKPDNVMISPWLPQQAVLAHPNTKVFVSHGGLLSSIEALYFGVPLLGIPIFGDQKTNMARAVRSGYGIKLELDDLTEETFSQTLNRLLTEPRYYQRTQELSKIFQDQPQTPLEKAVYSIEFIVRHKGAPFMRSPATHMHLYQVLLLDVMAGITLIIVLPLLILFWVIRKIVKVCSGTKPKSNIKKKKN